MAEALDDGPVDQPVVEAAARARVPIHMAGRTKMQVVELVEVPLVEQELVEARVGRGDARAASPGRRMYMYQAATKPMIMAIVADHLTQSGTCVGGFDDARG